MIVRLSQDVAGVDDAEARRDHARSEPWDEVGYNPGRARRLDYRIQSYRAERAFALFLGLTGWKRDPDGFGKPDIAGYSVRLASKPGYGLVIHDRDGDYPYALVEATPDPLEFNVVGWLHRNEALSLRAAGHGFQLQGTTDPWCIPQRMLRPFDP